MINTLVEESHRHIVTVHHGESLTLCSEPSVGVEGVRILAKHSSITMRYTCVDTNNSLCHSSSESSSFLGFIMNLLLLGRIVRISLRRPREQLFRVGDL